MGDPHDLPPLTTAGGDWRVRVHARGRDTDVDGVAREPFEHYLVQVWPAAPAPETAHRLTDGYGAGLRGSGLPPV
jgi:hypothetical protein